MNALLSKTALLITSIALNLALSGQVTEIYQVDKNAPVVIQYYDGETVHKQFVTDVASNPVARMNINGEVRDFDLSYFVEGDHKKKGLETRESFTLLEPGAPVEGDLHSDIAYTRDGSMFAVIYQNSDNMTFYDAETYEMIETVQLIRQPVNLWMGGEHAYVACHEGHAVVVVSLEDFSITNYIPVDGTPCQVEVSPGEDTAFIACDSWMDGWMIAVDMSNNNEVLYSTHDPYFHHYGWGGPMGRTLYEFSKFHLSPKGDQFICGDTSTFRPTIFNASNGHPMKTFWIGGWRGAAYSPSGDTVYIYSSDDDTVKMLRVNTTDLTIIDSIHSAPGCFYGITDYTDLAVSHDGNEVLITDAINDRYCRFDFDNHSCQVISPFSISADPPMFTSSDGQNAVIANFYKLQIVNLETGTLIDNWPSSMRTGNPLCGSPVENTLVAGNSPGMGIEKLWAVDFSNITSLTQEASITCGAPPEADMPHVGAISEDGQKVLTVNLLTSDFSIIDLNDNTLDTLVYCKDLTGLIPIPRTNEALIYGENKVFSHIVSQEDFSEIAEIQAGGIRDALVSSDGTSAYLLEYQVYDWMRITKVHIDGKDSYIEKQLMSLGCDCAINFTNDEVEIYTKPALSPDDRLLLIGDDNDTLGPVVNIIDAETLELLCQVPVLDECVYDFAFTDDSKRVAVVNGYNAMIPIIYLDRENSYVENYIPIATRSFSAAYNKVDGLFYVLDQNDYVFKVDPVTGEIVDQFDTFDDTNWDIEIDLRGNPMILTNYSMIYEGEPYAMPGYTTIMDYDEEHDVFISAVQGPDVICVFNPLGTGIQQFKPGNKSNVTLFPNPVTDNLIISSEEMISRIEVSTLNGEVVLTEDVCNKTVEIGANRLTPGLYIIKATIESGVITRKVVVM